MVKVQEEKIRSGQKGNKTMMEQKCCISSGDQMGHIEQWRYTGGVSSLYTERVYLVSSLREGYLSDGRCGISSRSRDAAGAKLQE